jgi:hypothetical protein
MATTKKKRVKKPIDLLGMTPAEARVAIARDVVSQIRAQKYRATHGAYCRTFPKSRDRDGIIDREDVGGELQPLIKTRMDSCDVCAKGGLFVSAIRKFDDFKVSRSVVNKTSNYSSYSFQAQHSQFNDGILVTSHLRKFFAKEQLELIEYSFERGHCGTPKDDELALRAKIFGNKIDWPEERMLAIMKNIIKNKGEFVPPEITEEQRFQNIHA